MGLMYATGGKQAAEGSLMCKHGVNLKLIREDNTDNMQSLLVAFAEELKKGDKNPAKGAHFVAIMGDGSARVPEGRSTIALRKLGPEYEVAVVGSAGYSRGEDKFMGPPAWKDNPQAARGGLVAGVLRDGDWNIAMKWLGDNGIPNNPDETTLRSRRAQLGQRLRLHRRRAEVRHRLLRRPQEQEDRQQGEALRATASSPGRRATSPWPRRRAAWSRSSRPRSTARRCRTSSSASRSG